MIDHPMSVALAARMTVWLILIVSVAVGVALAAGFRLRIVSEDYPEPIDDALSGYSESDNQQQDYCSEERGDDAA